MASSTGKNRSYGNRLSTDWYDKGALLYVIAGKDLPDRSSNMRTTKP
ncbi:MAG: hypothetical protein ACM32O_16055 [Clostridia bacterium]